MKGQARACGGRAATTGAVGEAVTTGAVGETATTAAVGDCECAAMHQAKKTGARNKRNGAIC